MLALRKRVTPERSAHFADELLQTQSRVQQCKYEEELIALSLDP